MIIITAYHGRKNDNRFATRKKYLEETIASIDRQNISNLFHLIVDDGSTDDVYDELKIRYQNSLNRRIVHRDKQPNEPLTSTNARNFALKLCLSSQQIEGVDISKQSHLTFIDSDDLVLDLKKRELYIQKTNADFLYTDALLFFTDSETAFFWKGISPDKAYYRFWIYGCMPYPTMTWSFNFLKNLTVWVGEKYGIQGLFDPKIGCGEDVDVALSSFEYAFSENYKIHYLPEITAGYRLHELSLSAIRDHTTRIKEENTVLVRHFGRFMKVLLHMGRFIVRPECYISQLMSLKNKFRLKTNKNNYLANDP